MIPKRVTVENFLSFGPKTEIHFSDGEPLWVLGGPNGIGKSAVFDAMTYCLFAQHRGGSQDFDALIHHGRDGFSVGFEFEFAGEHYLITRNRKSNKSTQSVQRRIDGEWRRVPNVDSVAGLKDWVTDTIGLNFASFQASVLLRQGEAEAILTATGAARMTILKSVLGLERFQELSARVGDDAKTKKAELKALEKKREDATEVSESELGMARAAVESAVRGNAESAAALESAAVGLNQARLWEESEPKRLDLDRKLCAAESRAAESERIRREYADHRDLARDLPTLRHLVPLREKLAADEPKLSRALADRTAAEGERIRLDAELERERARSAGIATEAETCEREANEHRKEIDRLSKFLSAANAATELEDKLRIFPPTLADDCAAAQTNDAVVKVALTAAQAACTTQETLLKHAVEQRAKFDDLEVGAKCSACGNEVSPEHAEKERRAAKEHADAEGARAEECRRALATAKDAERNAAKLRADSEAKLRERDTLSAKLSDKRRDLETFGGTSDAALLQSQMAERTASAEIAERAATAAKAEQRALTAKLARLSQELTAATETASSAAEAYAAAEKRIAEARTRCATLVGQLPEERGNTTAEVLTALESTFADLTRRKIADEFGELQLDEARRDEWRKQLADLAAQIASIPEAARRSAGEASQAYESAKLQQQAATDAWQIARDALAQLQTRAEAFSELGAEIVRAEIDERIAAKLHALLGNAGLLRELVRIAEAEIVRFGNDTLQKLSDGELSLELSREPKEETEALVLVVRSQNSPEPTPVNYLSGSQKFRVALAIALGIGQFASGQARPLECVIIDEGFGSLDKEGLRAAAEELNRLKRHLKRIILVSHQDEFTDHFPVVIRLSKTEDGVKATTVRR